MRLILYQQYHRRERLNNELELLNGAQCAALGANISIQSNLLVFLDGRSQRQSVRDPSDHRQVDHAGRCGRRAAV